MKTGGEVVTTDWEEHAHIVCGLTAEFFGIPAPELRMRHVQAGCAYAHKNLVIIPWWSAEMGEHYFTAYVVHEVTHVYRYQARKRAGILREPSHGDVFHVAERKALAQWGLEPVYTRAYVKELKFKGQVVFKRPPRKQKEKPQYVLLVCSGHNKDLTYS